MRREDERDSSWQREGDQSRSLCEPRATSHRSHHQSPQPLLLLPVPPVMAPPAASGSTGRRLTAHIISTDTLLASQHQLHRDVRVRACVCVYVCVRAGVK